jgi:hypothetical protein
MTSQADLSLCQYPEVFFAIHAIHPQYLYVSVVRLSFETMLKISFIPLTSSRTSEGSRTKAAHNDTLSFRGLLANQRKLLKDAEEKVYVFF